MADREAEPFENMTSQLASFVTKRLVSTQRRLSQADAPPATKQTLQYVVYVSFTVISQAESRQQKPSSTSKTDFLDMIRSK